MMFDEISKNTCVFVDFDIFFFKKKAHVFFYQLLSKSSKKHMCFFLFGAGIRDARNAQKKKRDHIKQASTTQTANKNNANKN